MAKIKYNPSATPILNEHDGYTFQPNNYGQSVFPSSKSARKRYKHQFLRMHNNQRAVINWRNMSPETKQAWNDFALAFPQPAKRDPNTFLTGFQCFIKRNSFCFLNHGILTDFMLEPDLVISDEDEITFEIKASNTVIECAELYIRNFGILPQVGDKLLCYASVYSEYSGHFYESIRTSLIVEEIYIDSFQVSVIVPDSFKSVTVSLYLSKPVSPGQEYTGTKCRYMGCFTTKTFLELQDTPDSYSGKGEQIVRVNITEDGLEFSEIDSGGNAFNPITVDGQDNVTADSVAQALELVAGDGITIETDNTNKQIIISAAGGGGFNCDDLLNCDIFQQIAEIISEDNVIAIPEINYGRLYNLYFFLDGLNLSSSDDWFLPSQSQWESLFTYLGGNAVAGGKLKETGLEHWQWPNTGATNDFKTSFRAAGKRQFNGPYSAWNQNNHFWTTTYFAGYYRSVWAVYNDTKMNINQFNAREGHSIRFWKSAPGVPDNTMTTYIGNDKKIYPAICINENYILCRNLAETLLRDLSEIPYLPINSEWNATRSFAMGDPNGDPTLV